MFARTAAFGLLALLVTVPVATAAPLDCPAVLTGYHTTPTHGLAGDLAAKVERLQGCFFAYDTDVTSPVPEVQVQFVPYTPALLEGVAEPMPAPLRAEACRAGFDCAAQAESTDLEVPPVEAPVACIQVWPYSAVCAVAYNLLDLVN